MIKKIIFTAILIATTQAIAQLTPDPWAHKTPAQDKNERMQIQVQTSATTPNTLHTDLPDYVGENTTWDKSMGQATIAPDVNITNMLLMTQHLRNLGYQIPDGLDTLITTAPERLRREILGAMYALKNSTHPIAAAGNSYAQIFESRTGLSIQNLIENSLRIIDARR